MGWFRSQSAGSTLVPTVAGTMEAVLADEEVVERAAASSALHEQAAKDLGHKWKPIRPKRAY